MNQFYYLRGVAPHEAREASNGLNGRVCTDIAATNRGTDQDRLAFGMNESETPGINWELVEEFYIEACYYANMGAFAEANPQLQGEMQRNVNSKNRGYILIYKTDLPLRLHKQNLQYGDAWRTTSELPDDIDNNLISIFPANPMERPGAYMPFRDKDYSLFGRIAPESFDKLNKIVNP